MTVQGPRQPPPDSAARDPKRGRLARLGTYARAATAVRTMFRRELPIVANSHDRFDTALWLVSYAECFQREALAVRAEVVRQLRDEAGGWRALEARLGVKESTLRGWAAHERG